MALALLAAAGLGCESRRSLPVAPAASAAGLSAEVVSPAVQPLFLTRDFIPLLIRDWAERGSLDAQWVPETGTGAWLRTGGGYSTVHVGGIGGGAGEIRTGFELNTRLWLLRGGVPGSPLMDADSADLRVRLRTYRTGLGAAYSTVESPYDITVDFRLGCRLDSARADGLRGPGTLAGWWESPPLARTVYVYQGESILTIEYPGHPLPCPAERLDADIRIFENATERDRFRGAFAAALGENAYTGALVSERGPWRYLVNGDRGCSVPAAPGRLAVGSFRVTRE